MLTTKLKLKKRLFYTKTAIFPSRELARGTYNKTKERIYKLCLGDMYIV